MASLFKAKAPKGPFYYRCVEDTHEEDDKDSPTIAYGRTVSFEEKLNKGSTRVEWPSQRKSFVVESPSVDSVSSSKESTIQFTCGVACGSRKPGFPGACAVLLDVKNMHRLRDMPYRVSWKADSTRYLMLIRNENEVYMVNRDNAVFKINNLVFPLSEDPKRRLTNTLVDGEVVFYNVDGNSYPYYVIYDIIMIEGRRDIARKNHSERLECIDKEIIKPREALTKANRLNTSLEPFGIRLKLFWDVCEAQKILEKYAPSLIPEADGLTFFPECEAYKSGQCSTFLKWVPKEKISVDFLLNIVTRNSLNGATQRFGELHVITVPFAEMQIEDEDVLDHDGKIIECCWDFERNQWKFIRVRTDRSYPNALQTANNNFGAILNPVTKDKLFKLCHKKGQPQSGMADFDRKRPSLDGSDKEGQLMSPPDKRLQQ